MICPNHLSLRRNQAQYIGHLLLPATACLGGDRRFARCEALSIARRASLPMDVGLALPDTKNLVGRHTNHFLCGTVGPVHLYVGPSGLSESKIQARIVAGKVATARLALLYLPDAAGLHLEARTQCIELMFAY